MVCKPKTRFAYVDIVAALASDDLNDAMPAQRNRTVRLG